MVMQNSITVERTEREQRMKRLGSAYTTSSSYQPGTELAQRKRTKVKGRCRMFGRKQVAEERQIGNRRRY
jgi:hypothetical protein